MIWDRVFEALLPTDHADLVAMMAEAETRRARADYDTGTITLADCLVLRGLSRLLRPETVIEIGTFIGTSTHAIDAPLIYTCDKDNDCLPSTPQRVVFAKTRSSFMLKRLLLAQTRADLWFFDGRIKDEDLTPIVRLSHRSAVYAFHDTSRTAKGAPEKGLINIDKLQPCIARDYVVVPPPTSVPGTDTVCTIGLLTRESRA